MKRKNGVPVRLEVRPEPTVPVREVKCLPPGRYPYCVNCGFGSVLHDAKGNCVGPNAKATKWDPEPEPEEVGHHVDAA